MKPNRIEDFSGFRNRLLDDALLWVAAAAVPGAALSVWRATVVGWKPVMGLHLVILGFLWMMYLLRSRLPYHTRVSGLLTVMVIAIYTGLAQFGPAAGAQSFAILFAFTSMLFLNPRAAWLLVAANTTCLVFFGYAATRHWFQYDFDFQTYAHHPITWFNLLWTLVSYGTILAYIVWRMMTELSARRHAVESLLEQNQEQLREIKLAKQRLSATLENTPNVAIQWYDRDGRIIYWNRASELIYGWASKEAVGKTLDQLIQTTEEARNFLATLKQIDASGETVGPAEFTTHHRDASPRIVSSTIFPIQGDGAPLFACMDVDVTERRQIEQMQHDILESMPDAVVLSNQKGIITLVNNQTLTLSGYQREELIGSPVEILLPERLRGVHTDHRRGYLNEPRLRPMGNLTLSLSLSTITIDGREIPVDVAIGPVHTREGMMVVASLRDISERKQIETRLRDSEERFSFAVEGAGDGVWDWNMQTNELLCSRLYMAMLGYAENELPHHIDTWVSSVHPDDMQRVQENLEAYLAGRIANYAVELRLRCKDGSYKWILCRGMVATRDGEGKPTRMIGIHADITVRKQAEAELIAAREAAEQASKAKSAFLANMSHELRTPLNAIIGFAQILDMGSPVPLVDAQKEPVKHILNSGRHLLRLINDVLDLARIEAGRLDLTIETVALVPLIEEVVALSQPSAAACSVVIRQSCNDGLHAAADRFRLRQILLNLLSNAVKYNRKGGTATLTCQAAGNVVRITIADTGPGITEARWSEIFQPFHRLGAEQSVVEGTGIGLVVCKQLAEAMNGRIGFESEVDVGSRFWVELPLARPLRQAAIEVSVLTDETSLNADIRGRVLYVEDNPVNLNVMQHLFRRLPGVELLIAKDAETGLFMIQERRPDLVLMDINLPGMSGFDALRILKSEPLTAAIPVIAISAAAMPRDIKAGLDAGFLAYFTKPFDVVALLSQIKGILQADEQQGVRRNR